ncbi:MAG TPA: ABC transporter ATP-binding protein [Microthrixaceae bacterium]|nr:ABC transporter ATP-binding protein [Microthrixaceae bacterium]
MASLKCRRGGSVAEEGIDRVPLLEVTDVGVRFGGVVALDGLSFEIEREQVCALIGPNGAGKTTLFNVVSRLYEPSEGTVVFDGVDLLSLPPHKIATLGIARTFQNLALVPGLSVLDNVLVGAQSVTSGGFWIGALGLSIRSDRVVRKDALGLLERLHLDHLAERPCAGLPFGTLKRIEIVRALMSRPKLLMLDEPASGLTHGEVDELGVLLRSLRDDLALTVLLVEHHMGMVMGISDRVVVMEFGQKIADGTPDEVRNDQRVVAAYLGGPA